MCEASKVLSPTFSMPPDCRLGTATICRAAGQVAACHPSANMEDTSSRSSPGRGRATAWHAAPQRQRQQQSQRIVTAVAAAAPISNLISAPGTGRDRTPPQTSPHPTCGGLVSRQDGGVGPMQAVGLPSSNAWPWVRYAPQEAAGAWQTLTWPSPHGCLYTCAPHRMAACRQASAQSARRASISSRAAHTRS